MGAPALLLLRPRLPRPTAQYRLDEGSGQTLRDATGHGYDGTLGSTAGSDTNDPTWTGGGLLFATDDYVRLPLTINPNNDFSVYICANVGASAPVAMEAYWSAGNSTNGTPFVDVVRAVDGSIGLYMCNDAASSASRAIAAVDVIPGIRLFKAVRSGGNFMVADVRSGKKSQQFTKPNPITLDRMALGCLLRTSASYYLNQPVYWCECHQRATSDAEDQVIYRNIKRQLARPDRPGGPVILA